MRRNDRISRLSRNVGRALATASLVALLSHTAAAQAPDRKDVCVARASAGAPGSVVDPIRLVRGLHARHKVTLSALDRNADGAVSLQEQYAAATEPNFCAGCSPADAAALKSVRQDLYAFVDSLPSANYHLVDARTGAAARNVALADLVGASPRIYEIRCLAAAEGDSGGTPAGDDKTQRSAFDNFRLRGKASDLHVDRSDKGKFKPLTPAVASIAGNREARDTTVAVSGVLGYALDLTPANQTWLLEGVPFVQIERRKTPGRNSPGNPDIEKVAFGGALAIWYPGLGASDMLQITPKFVTDGLADTKIGQLDLRWRPRPPALAMGQYNPLVPGLLFRYGVDGLFEGGEVFDDGGNAELQRTRTFARIGGSVGFALRGDTSIPALDALEASVDFKYLEVLSGRYSHVSLLETTLRYHLTPDGGYSFGITYSKGRAEDVLKKVDQWRAEFGVKF